MKILVRSPNWIGDQILAFPFFYYLRRAFPKAHICVVCVPWVKDVQFKGLVDEVFTLDRPAESHLFAKLSALEKSAARAREMAPWDLGISLPNSFSAAWFLFRAGVKKRRGYAADGRGFLLTDPIPLDREVQHRADSYVKLLENISQNTKTHLKEMPAKKFWGVLPENDLDSGIPGILKSFNAQKEWKQNTVFECPSEPYWIMAPGTTAESRRWPLDRFATLARLIQEETGWKGLIVGGQSESELAHRLLQDPTLKLEDWTARGSVGSYWKLFQNARFTVCNDSGLGHVASLCGSPVQVVWGAGNPKRTEPIGPGKVKILFNPVDCWPCESNICFQPDGRKLECLKGIEPEALWKEIRSGISV